MIILQAPIPIKPWEGIKDGSKDGPPCLQVIENPFDFEYFAHKFCLQIAQFREPEIIGSEDCLWLNVYTPEVTNTELKPVLVWIYGGRFLVGTASSKLYSPNFMMDHDIVVVSIQWRVGPYGFLSTGDSVAPGNYGFQDQVSFWSLSIYNFLALFFGNSVPKIFGRMRI